MIQRSERHLVMSYDGSDDAHQINIIPRYDPLPIVSDVGNLEFARDFFSIRTMGAGNRYDARAIAILKSGDLRCARKSGANYSDSDDICNCIEPLFEKVDVKSPFHQPVRQR